MRQGRSWLRGAHLLMAAMSLWCPGTKPDAGHVRVTQEPSLCYSGKILEFRFRKMGVEFWLPVSSWIGTLLPGKLFSQLGAGPRQPTSQSCPAQSPGALWVLGACLGLTARVGTMVRRLLGSEL